MSYHSQVGHVGSGFSIVDILVVLYFLVLQIRPKQPRWSGRDHFILSKGHAANALYAVLAERGFFPKSWLKTFCLDDGKLGVHPEHSVPGVEWTTGSLGHGLSVGCGIALGLRVNQESRIKNQGKKRAPGKVHDSYFMLHNSVPRVFVLLSDAECNEGSIWEAALFAGHHKLDNFVALLDYNKVQAFGTTEEVLALEPLGDKWRAFGWNVMEVDGHDHQELVNALSHLPDNGKPTVIIAHTIRGKGVSFMEHEMKWHYVAPNREEYKLAMEELDQNVK